MNKVTVIDDTSFAPCQTTIALQDEVEEVTNPSVEPSPPLTPPSLDIYASLDCKPVGCHVDLFSQSLSSRSIDPTDFGVLHSSISNSTCDVHKHQVVDRVGVEKPTNVIIFYEYVWEYEEEITVNDDLLLSAPHPLYPDVFYGPTISELSCENSLLDVSTSDNSQAT